jgi:hypothetical protein
MKRLLRFLRDQRGAGAAEFALVLPIFILFLLGMIDIGRYAWALNEAQKATQVGVRWAVATDMIPTGLASWSFAVDQETPILQGNPIPESAFPGVRCVSDGEAVSCSCGYEDDADDLPGECEFPLDAASVNAAAFQEIVDRMRSQWGPISAENVVVRYQPSGLGYSGTPDPDPAEGVFAPDVSPLVTVELRNIGFPLFFTLGQAVPLPSFASSLTMEDASGDFANF